VEKLTSWLLYVTGCLPIRLQNMDMDIDNYYVEPPLYRNQRADELLNVTVRNASRFMIVPNKRVLTSMSINAAARCFLFKNVTESDMDYTNHYNEFFQLLGDLREYTNF
jgi:hypothetical protein